jgi:drug/metabolite transporter (DMT)-like permease
MVLATLSFTVMVALVKVARAELSTFEVVFWRTTVALPVAAVISWEPGFRVYNRRLMLARVVLGFTAMSSYYGASKGLPLAELTIISKLQPLLVAAAAPLLLGAGERPGPLIWGALALGLLGGLALIAPGLSGGGPALSWGLVALASAGFSAGAHTCLRGLGATENSRTLVFWFHLATLIFSGVLMLATSGLTLPPVALWPVVAGVGLAATAGQLLMTRAYALDKAALVAGASYTSPLFAVGADVLFFSLTPGWNVAAGGALVVGAGLLLLWPRAAPASG